MANLLSTSYGINTEYLKHTLKKNELARSLSIYDLVARLDPALPLALEAKALLDAHMASGAPAESIA